MEKPKFLDCPECQSISDNINTATIKDRCNSCGRKVADIYQMWDQYYEDESISNLIDSMDKTTDNYNQSTQTFIETQSRIREANQKKITDLKVGDVVYLDCDQGLGQSSCGREVISDIIVRYNEVTGEPYKLICLSGSNMKFDMNGNQTGKWGMFYIYPIQDDVRV